MRGTPRALLLSALLALLPSTSFADDPYAEYRIPEHYWRSWTANLNAGGNHQLSNGFGGQAELGNLGGSLATSIVGGYDSDPRSSAYGLTLMASGSRLHQTQNGENAFQTLDANRRNQATTQQGSAFLAFSRYPWSAPLGFSVASGGRATFYQAWDSQAQTIISPPTENRSTSNSTQGSWDVQVSLTAALNWGRVRDATPVYQVQVLEQRLLDEGVIQRPLSAGARQRLASLYTTEAELAFAHERPSKYFWRELERMLQEDGVLGAGGLDAYTVQRLLEPLVISGHLIARTRGFTVGPQVSLGMEQLHQGYEAGASSAFYQNGTLVSSFETSTPRTTMYSRFDFILSGVGVAYHRPFGPRWQLDGTSSGLLSESGEHLRFVTALQGTWLVADRWYANARFFHYLDATGPGVDRRPTFWQVNSSASLSYFLEDSWALELSATQVQSHSQYSYQRDAVFSLGVTFQFAGFLNAPGLFEPMRLTPPSR